MWVRRAGTARRLAFRESPVMLGESTIGLFGCRRGALAGERAAEILCPGVV